VTRTEVTRRVSILAGVDWASLNAVVAYEQANRERNTPTISIFPW